MQIRGSILIIFIYPSHPSYDNIPAAFDLRLAAYVAPLLDDRCILKWFAAIATKHRKSSAGKFLQSLPQKNRV